LLRHGKAPETARRIDDGQDCGCNVKKKYSIQCRHEYKRDGCQFVASRFSVRYIKSISDPVKAAAGPVNEADHQRDDGNADSDAIAMLEDDDDDDSDEEYNVPLSQLGAKKRRPEDNDEDTDVPLSQLMPKKKAKEKPASYSE
jgi:hypothetical protein